MIDYKSLNYGQRQIFDAAMEWWKNPVGPFEISGPPGSGKTYLINAIVEALGIPSYAIAPMAYTGAAAINMRKHGLSLAKTIHSWLYHREERIQYDKNGNVIMDPIFNKPKIIVTYVEREYLDGIELIIVDEGGSVPPNMRRAIEKHNIPVIVAGDLNQLPPISGIPAYLNDPSRVHILTEIMRQGANSDIVTLSKIAIQGQKIQPGWYGNNVLVIYKEDLTDDMIRKSDIIICSRNETRDYYNNRVRKNILNYVDKLPQYGERVVCRKNNWNLVTSDGINLTNGLLGNVYNYPKFTYDRKTDTFGISFMPDLSSGGFEDLRCSYSYFLSDAERRNKLKETGYLTGELFEFGYAITTHMSQGSEYNNGIYIEEPLRKDINHKLNYVGLTRFKNFCIYVKNHNFL